MAYGIEMLLKSSPTGFGTLPKHVTPLPLDGVCDRCKDVWKAGAAARSDSRLRCDLIGAGFGGERLGLGKGGSFMNQTYSNRTSVVNARTQTELPRPDSKSLIFYRR